MSIFSHVAMPRPQHNTFDLSHSKKFSCKIGQLVPIMCTETVPGDSFTIKPSNMLRFAPLIAPVMHQTTVYTHYFFVPNRILWDKWEDFITGGEDGYADPVFPTFTPAGSQRIKPGDLADYLGLASAMPGVPGSGQYQNTSFNALPFAAYNKIYNDYYRDENLIDPLKDKCNDGNNDFSQFENLQNRAWQHDYFTSALPWTQKGPEATIPLGTTAPITYDGTQGNLGDKVFYSSTQAPGPNADLYIDNQGGVARLEADFNSQSYGMNIDNSDQLSADLSQATASSINDLRRAFRLQEWLERNARGGSRYIEVIMAHFGVRSSDARLQRPEFLGGNSTPVQISEVLQTSDASAEVTPQGNMAGHGLSVGQGDKFSYKCEEHGFIIGIMSVMPKTAYQQGVPKIFTKFDKFDYFWPSFANIGEQPIINQELYHNDTDSANEEIFGYTPRYAEYKYIPSTVHGSMRTSLNFWHMGRIFSSRPALNQQFIECDAVETQRVFAVNDPGVEDLYCYFYNEVKARRPMPYFGTPTI